MHTTAYFPQIHEDGSVEISSTSDATDYKKFRNTVHTSLNHRVSGHEIGGWSHAPYTVIGNFAEVHEANGVPTSFNTVDTWWTRGPGEVLKIPNAMLVMPAESDFGGLCYVNTETNRAHYKSNGFTAHDFASIAQSFHGEHEFAIANFLKKMETILYGLEEATNFPRPSIPERTQKIYSTLLQARHDKAEEVDRFLVGKVHEMATQAAISKMGYEHLIGDKWGWVSGKLFESKDYAQTYAEEIGSQCLTHYHSPYKALEREMRTYTTLAQYLEEENFEEISGNQYLKQACEKVVKGVDVWEGCSALLEEVDEKTQQVSALTMKECDKVFESIRGMEKMPWTLKMMDSVAGEEKVRGGKRTTPFQRTNWVDSS